MRRERGKTQNGMPVGLKVAPTDRADALASASMGPAGPPAPGQAKPKQQEEGLYNGSPWIMLLKKGATRNKSLCILSHNGGQKNPYDSSLWY